MISEVELMSAFLRQELLTTLLVNKVMQRAVTAKVNILKNLEEFMEIENSSYHADLSTMSLLLY